MRDIKFRLWNNIQDKMLPHNRIDFDFIFDGNEHNDFNLMQFTGLTDKNGKEIYEGDIVRILYTDWGSKPQGDTRTLEQYLIDIAHIGKIEYHAPSFFVMIKNRYDEWSENTTNYGKYGYIEVIGNIYQNPELINQ